MLLSFPCIAIRVTFNSLWSSDVIWLPIWVNIGSGNGLLPNGTKPLPGPMLISHHRKSVEFAQEHELIFCIMRLKIIFLKLLPHLPGANELSKYHTNIFIVKWGLHLMTITSSGLITAVIEPPWAKVPIFVFVHLAKPQVYLDPGWLDQYLI